MTVKYTFPKPHQRLFAFVVDLILLHLVMLAGYILISLVIPLVTFSIATLLPIEGIVFQLYMLIQSVVFVGLVLGIFLYFPIMESTKRGATYGKRFFKLKVVTVDGKRLSFPRSLGRYVLKILLSSAFLVTYFPIFFTQKRQALHGLLSKTMVVRV